MHITVFQFLYRISGKNAPLHSMDIHAHKLADRRIPILLYLDDPVKL